MLRNLQLHKALLLSAALLSTTACMPAFGRSLVDIDVVDRDTGNGCPKPRIAATTGSPARPATATPCA